MSAHVGEAGRRTGCGANAAWNLRCTHAHMLLGTFDAPVIDLSPSDQSITGLIMFLSNKSLYTSNDIPRARTPNYATPLHTDLADLHFALARTKQMNSQSSNKTHSSERESVASLLLTPVSSCPSASDSEPQQCAFRDKDSVCPAERTEACFDKREPASLFPKHSRRMPLTKSQSLRLQQELELELPAGAGAGSGPSSSSLELELEPPPQPLAAAGRCQTERGPSSRWTMSAGRQSQSLPWLLSPPFFSRPSEDQRQELEQQLPVVRAPRRR